MSLPNLLPPLSDEEYATLRASLQEHGWWPEYPAVKDELGNVLVGHHRLEIADELGIDSVVVIKRGLSDWEKIQFAITGDTARRHLTVDQRRELLRRLIEVHDEVLAAEAEAARKAGNARGGRSRVSDETELRAAAAEATKSEFNGPVTVAPRQKVDRLETYGNLLGVSRATVARDEQILDRKEKIEEAAEKMGSVMATEIAHALNQPHPNLRALEQEVGIAPAAPVPAPVPPVDEDREAALDMLAMGLASITYKPFTADDARAVVHKAGLPVSQIIVDLMNVMRSMSEIDPTRRDRAKGWADFKKGK